ncbi:MAG: DNA polymerase III subunit delta [Clostridia bacterium]|nr:DNA polymerase III subunit delta [Clostridia bacterium]
MAASPTLQELKNQLNNKKLSSLYLFFGEETFLIDLYIDKIKALVPDMDFPDFNRISLDGKTAPLTEIADAVDGFPMMADKKLVIINDSGAFKGKLAENIREFYISIIKNISSDTVVIFRESDVDKRSAVYKAAAKNGTAVEFARLGDSDLAAWVIREAASAGKKITRANAELLVSVSDRGLETLKNEVSKLSAYAEEEEITAPIIERLASRSTEAKVFDLCDLITAKDADGALSMLEALKTNKTSPFSIMYLLYAAFEKALKAQLLSSRGEPFQSIAAALAVPKFAVQKYLKVAKTFTEKELTQLLILIPELDLSIKRGAVGQWQAVERLVFTGLGKDRSNEKV